MQMIRAVDIERGDQIRAYAYKDRYVWKTVARVRVVNDRRLGRLVVVTHTDGKRTVCSPSCLVKQR